ncbi:unnamed protein product [Orchesella dallaii]|uniref:Uncharacterized protein n=1 Tax=Orchesella dallaii TaxID=48710 RepID=A0ABP1Q6E4_9HEXA
MHLFFQIQGYHSKEKAKWVTHSGWHGPPYNTNTYQKGYEKGKAIINAINFGQAKVNAIASIFKPKGLGWRAPPPKGWKSGPPPPVYGPPGWSTGVDFAYGSHSDPTPSVKPPSYSYGAPPPPSSIYGAPPPSSAYGAPAESYGVPPLPSTSYSGGAPLSYDDYYHGGNRKNGGTFSSLLSSISGGGADNQVDNQNEKKNSRRVYKEPVSPSGFYTSAYNTPGEQYTGIMTNEPSTQGDKFLRGDDDILSSSSPSIKSSSSVSAPNEILESYLEQRLKAEAEKQKDTERKQETQQLVQLLRKAYLKQLVDSLQEEETTKTAENRQLSSLSSSIESLFGSRESRSTEQRNNNEVEGSVGSSGSSNSGGSVGGAQNLIRDILIKEVFTSGESTSGNGEGDHIDTAEVASITERVMSLSQSEREELIKGLDELGDNEEQVLQNPKTTESTSTERMSEELLLALVSSTENTLVEGEEEKKREERSEKTNDADENGMLQLLLPANWVQTENSFAKEGIPFSVRIRRQTAAHSGSEDPAPTPSPEDQQKIQGFVDDIRKFFTLLSALDQDQCLQKLVCDVHTNEKDLTTLTLYEKNILTTFKLMKALMPEGEEDSSTKYRYAAVVGETGQSMELCQQTYTSCGYSTSQIVALGTQEEATPSDWAGAGTSVASTPGPIVVPTVLQQRERETTTEAPALRSDFVSQMPPTSRRRYQQRYKGQDRYQSQEQQQPQQYQYQRRRRPQQTPQEQEPQQSESSSYGDFFSAGEFFRSLWSENLMGRMNRRNRRMHSNTFSSPLEYEMGV